MFIPIHVETTAGDQATVLSNRFIDFGHDVENLMEPLGQIGESLGAQVAEQFATEGAGGYTGTWAPLSYAYGKWKEQKSPGTPILVGVRPTKKGSRQHPTRPESYAVSGKMKYELLDPLAMHVEPMRLLYAPTSQIAGFHQTGTSKMPARPIISLYPATLREWDRFFVQYLAKVMKGLELE